MSTTQQTKRHFGTFIRTRRQELGLSLRQLEERTGIPNSRISRWERGLELPDRPDRLVSLAAGLGVELADLYAYSRIPHAQGLPALPAYLHQRYGHLAQAAQAEICKAADEIARTHGAALDSDRS